MMILQWPMSIGMMKVGISLPIINVSNMRICRRCDKEFPIEGNYHYCPQHRSGRKGQYKMPRFATLDGEADTVKDHLYRLFSMSNDPDNPLITHDAITFSEICEYLYAHFEKGTAYVGFFLGYDFNQWFKTLPMERAAMLLTAEGREKRKRKTSFDPTPFPVDWIGWEFDI